MSKSSFGDVSNLYQSTQKIQISRHRVLHQELRNFSIDLDQFERSLGELAIDDEYWRKFLIPLKRLRFGLCAAPFSVEARTTRILELVNDQQKLIEYSYKLYPNHAEDALNLLTALEPLADDGKNPLLDKLVELSDGKHVGWVIKESRLISDVETLISQLRLGQHISIVHPLQLKQLTVYDRLITVGPTRWFPESVFTAPRSSDLHVVIFDWINDSWKPENTFHKPLSSSGASNRKSIVFYEQNYNDQVPTIDPNSLLIFIDKSRPFSKVTSEKNTESYDTVDAIGMFLEGDWVVFIDASDNATNHIIDPDEEGEDRIRRVEITQIQPGTFILVRTAGGGDYIVPFADKIMGPRASKAREYQEQWKQKLREYVVRHGLFETSIALLDAGSDIANETNVRNWISPRNIRTQSFNDFSAIMKITGLSSEAKYYWDVMGEIRSAHRKAGNQIRKLLLAQVKDMDMNNLQKHGKFEFKLSEDDDDARLTAFRVEGIMRESVKVPYSRVGQPFKMDQFAWQK